MHTMIGLPHAVADRNPYTVALFRKMRADEVQEALEFLWKSLDLVAEDNLPIVLMWHDLNEIDKHFTNVHANALK